MANLCRSIAQRFDTMPMHIYSLQRNSVAILIDSMPLQRSTIQFRCHALLRFALPLPRHSKQCLFVAIPNHALPSLSQLPDAFPSQCDVIRFTSFPMLGNAVPSPLSAMPLLRHAKLLVATPLRFYAMHCNAVTNRQENHRCSFAPLTRPDAF